MADYKNFLKINGSHEWRNVSPDGYIDYLARYRKGGRVIYFNYALAKEMGLLPKNHPEVMNPKLEDILLKTFSIQIINEHDLTFSEGVPKDHLKHRVYMATRYLQLQHPNKQGRTSGDGRSIWNGMVRTKKMIFDISSCGTGGTILSPGAQETENLIPTGSDKYGYASGLADLDEMLSGAIMSEIMYREGMPTERCLVVIDYADHSAIGVRTAPNLLRPAHVFRYLKSDQWRELKKSMDYFVNRQKRNGKISFPKSGKAKYTKLLQYFTKTYAKLAAIMEEEYIFNWLAWDGDNVLADGSLLDYGSIRQFAAKHNKYRYDDVDRYSTNLTEQRYWCRRMVQTFAQAADYVVTKKKRPLEEFADHEELKKFDVIFKEERHKEMLWRVGFTTSQTEVLLNKYLDKVEAFRQALNYFEHVKTGEGEKKTSDGVDHPPVFLIRHVLLELPTFLCMHRKKKEWPIMPPAVFCNIMAASYIHHEDLKLTPYRKKQALNFQQLYHDLIRAAAPNVWTVLKSVEKRSAVINYPYRCTGDGLINIVDEAIRAKNRLSRQKLQEAMNRFIESQVLIPGKWKPIQEKELKGKTTMSKLLKKIQKNLEIYNERI